MTALQSHLAYEYETFPPDQTPPRELFIFMDNFDDLEELKPDRELLTRLTRSKPGRPLIHFIVCGTPLGMRGGDDFVRRVMQSRYGIATNRDAVGESPHNANVPRALREADLPMGRGFIIQSGKVETVQLALPWRTIDGLEDGMDFWIEQIEARWQGEERATWLEIPEGADGEEADPEATDNELAIELDPALVEAAKTALESVMDASILEHLPPAEMVELALSYELIELPETSHE